MQGVPGVRPAARRRAAAPFEKRSMAPDSVTIQRILLMNPPTGLYRRDDRCQCTVEDQTVNVIFPPTELLITAACAERAGATCRIADYPAERRTWDDFLGDVRDFQPDLLILNTTTATLSDDLQACRLARELRPGILTAGKGETLIWDAVAVLQDHPALDLVLPNEAEEAVEELAAGRPLPEVGGLHFRDELLKRLGLAPTPNLTQPQRKAQASKLALRREQREREKRNGNGSSSPDNGKTNSRAEESMTAVAGVSPNADARIYFTGKRPLQTDLDSLPYPARHLVRAEQYRSPETWNPLTVIHGNRGCPAQCIFCPAGVLTDFSVRYRSPENIVGELRECVERHGIREFLFHGDTFTLNRKWLLELCAAIRESGLDIRWGCNSRVDTIDDERARAMKAAGCWVVAFGIESGNSLLLEKMKKNATLDQAREAVAVCKRNGLRVHTFFVIGLPWETVETLEDTYRFALELDPDFFDFNIATPLPGTELFDIARTDALFEDGAQNRKATYASGALRTYSGLSSEALNDWRRARLLRMYLRPRYIARTLWRSGSPRVAANYLRAARKRLSNLLKTPTGQDA